ncbi:aminotransferase class IV [uncultured Kocuria sp.]|uniref:aminotransferase class IV n=1 Tax=uncultured Kocuria sp. TaxID=259305 RepID=UPI00263A04EB|nr:aminotransferase class IV [uncultured Kocuria sp.]
MTSTVVVLDAAHPGGVLVDPSVPLVRIDDQGLTRGDGVFETMRAVDGSVQKFEAHHQRLSASARLAQLPVPSARDVRGAVELALAHAAPGGDGGLGAEHSVKVVISRGTPEDGPWSWVAVSPVPETTFRQRREGVTAVLLPRGHDPAQDAGYPWLLPGAKTLSYAINMAALRHARSLGADEAVFTTEGRRVLEGATSSVVCARVRAGHRTLLTPEPSHGILPGTTQAKIFAAARRDGWELGYGPLYPADLMEADAVWLVSSVRLAVPVRRLDHQPLPVDPDLTRLVTSWVSQA